VIREWTVVVVLAILAMAVLGISSVTTLATDDSPIPTPTAPPPTPTNTPTPTPLGAEVVVTGNDNVKPGDTFWVSVIAFNVDGVKGWEGYAVFTDNLEPTGEYITGWFGYEASFATDDNIVAFKQSGDELYDTVSLGGVEFRAVGTGQAEVELRYIWLDGQGVDKVTYKEIVISD